MQEGPAADAQSIAAVLAGDTGAFEPLIARHQPRIFATARRYARREDEVEDIVQEVFLKAYQKLPSFRGDAPFEHWLMRVAIRTCYDFLRRHQRNRETTFTEITREDTEWLEHLASAPDTAADTGSDARELLQRVLEQLSPADRLVITLLELEERSVREIAGLTGWSETLVKVRAFRARRRMRKLLEALMEQVPCNQPTPGERL